MPGSTLNSEIDLVPDPKHDPIPLDMYGYGAVGLGVLTVGWWVGSHTTGVRRLACRLVGTLGGVYGVYMLVLAAGWQVFSSGLDRWMNRVRRTSAEQHGDSLLELRFRRPSDARSNLLDDLMDHVNAELGDAGECGEVHTSVTGASGDAVTYFVRGRDLDGMLAAVSRVAARVPLPPDTYVWVPSLTRPGFGTVLLPGVESNHRR